MTKCQTPNCQNKAEFQHILKLGFVNIAKQWVCSNCKEELEKRETKK
ncbi:hypothetical protein [endosymbiont GvMRE of Glomus versiforme]|nr:hypothetical protein [endosymbiont GvMRE of Glomus versiforme]RHZ37717.1 hypothetical protein GvMRE_I1g682 [endosymbiont GvMRE of Glomus versiforme]